MSYKISGGVQDVLDSAASLADVKSTTCTDGQLVAVKGTTFTDTSVIIDSYSANAVLKIEKEQNSYAYRDYYFACNLYPISYSRYSFANWKRGGNGFWAWRGK